MMTSMRMLAALLVAGGCLTAGAVRAEPEIGNVFQRPYWGATGTRVAGEREKLYFNTTVYAQQTVETDAGGSTALRFRDGTKLQVGASSSLVLDRFVYDPDAGAGDAAISFATGIFRFVSGRLRGDAVTLETPSATLAIRGTRFILAIDIAGNTNVWVIDGAVEGLSRAGGAPGTARSDQTLEITNGVPGVRILDNRTGPRDPAVESDLPLLGRPGERGGGGGDRGSPGGGSSGGDNRSGGSGGQ